jgi:hypothetical protein
MQGAELVQAKPGPARLIFGDEAWTDYDLSVWMRTQGGQPGSGRQGGAVYFRVVDPANYHTFGVGGYSGTWHEVTRSEDGQWKRDVPPLRRAYEVDRWYRVRISVRGDHFRCWLDDEELFDVVDPHFPRGRIGLGTWDSSVRWRDLRVSDPNGNELFTGFPDLPAAIPPVE